MTIIFFSRLFYPHIGGVETHVLEVGKRLVGRGHRVIVVTEEILTKDIPVYQLKDKSAKVMGEVEGIKIYRIPIKRDSGLAESDSARQNDGGKKFRIWWELWKLRHIIKSADIVHCHDVFFWYLPFRFLYPKKKVFTTFHGYETKFPPSKKAILIRKISEKLSWGNICVGDYIKKWYRTKPTFITYGGVDMHNYHTTVRGSYAKKIKIIFIGRLEEDTGIHIYLKALELLKQKKIDFEFDACGEGTFRSIAMKYGRVYGFVKDVSTYIDRSDFVFTSSYLSILEAISRGKIVFSAFQNKLKEDYLKMSPFARWIIIENTPRNLADKILYFMNHDDEKEKTINKAYEWVRTQTWDNVVTMYLNLWHIPLRHSYTDMGSVQIRRCDNLRGVTKPGTVRYLAK